MSEEVRKSAQIALQRAMLNLLLKEHKINQNTYNIVLKTLKSKEKAVA